MVSLLDRALLALSPKAALQRAAQREAARMIGMRSYDGGRNSRATYGWMAGSTSANAEVYGNLLALRNRARDLVRNNPHASKALRVLTNNIVGSGITALARTPDAAINKKIDALWKRFVEECDFNGQLDFYGLQRLAIRAMLEGGDTITRLRPVTNKKFAIPLKLQLLESDYLDHRKNGIIEGGKRVQQGIEFDSEGQRSAYFLFRDHPGEAPFNIPNSYISDRVPASTILHLYEIQRLGQIRGASWFAPGMIKARELDTYEEAELVRKRIEACVAAIVIGGDDENEMGITTSQANNGASDSGPSIVDSSGNKVEQFEPGLIAYARGGKDVKFTQPSVSRDYDAYKSSQLRSIAAAWDVTYEHLSGDLRGVNFSSIRIGLNEFRRSIEAMQWLTAVPMFFNPVWQAFHDFAQVSGALPANTPRDVEWTMPRFESADPKTDTNSDIAGIRAMLLSPQEAIRRRGGDPDQVLKDSADWHKKLEAAGVVSDADAAQTAKPGAGIVKGAEGGQPSETIVPPEHDDEVVAP
ncbi:MAG TPA: phage portal protein [Oxalobacteraceae bacterium]|jgi:lambda family phage portal protein|nr:phage portal protein [Oxalobacteraceae bacterium]